VLDNGVGIPAKVHELKPNLLDNECIKWATERRNTTKSTLQNAGYGLSNIVDFVKSNGGNLQILSGNGKYEIHNGKENLTNYELKEIVGTQIEFEILIENLEDAEIIETQFF
jgi:N6-adenosine-specific RNA methylase IME4